MVDSKGAGGGEWKRVLDWAENEQNLDRGRGRGRKLLGSKY